MSNHKLMLAMVALLAALLVACGGAQTAEPGAIPTNETPSAEMPAANAAAATARAQLAAQLGVAETDIQLISVEPAEFSDSCLGLGGPEESCLQAVTPGFVVMLSVGGETYEVRTDQTVQQVRVAGDMMPAADPEAAQAAAVATLASQLGLTEAEIEMVSLEAAEFSDSCLGLGGPEESCAQVITPGFIFMLSAGGQTYEVHTDATGQVVRVAEGTTAEGGMGDAAVAAVQELLSAQLGVALGDVQLVSVEQAEFSDGCLELGQPDESCLQAITPGFIVTVDVQGTTYQAHTDETGAQVRVRN